MAKGNQKGDVVVICDDPDYKFLGSMIEGIGIKKSRVYITDTTVRDDLVNELAETNVKLCLLWGSSTMSKVFGYPKDDCISLIKAGYGLLYPALIEDFFVCLLPEMDLLRVMPEKAQILLHERLLQWVAGKAKRCDVKLIGDLQESVEFQAIWSPTLVDHVFVVKNKRDKKDVEALGFGLVFTSEELAGCTKEQRLFLANSMKKFKARSVEREGVS